MSSKVFKTKLGKEGLKKGATYKRGEYVYDLKLVNEIVGRCETVLQDDYDELVDFIRARVPKQLDTIEHFDQDAFLEAIVTGWQQNVDYKNLHFALTHSIEALHSVGITTFNLDLTIVPKQLFVMFPRLKGTEESPIDITCLGEVRVFGSMVEYCNLEFGDYVRVFGKGAKFSEFRFTGPQDTEVVPGWGAEDSAYYLPCMTAIPFSVGEEPSVYEVKFNSDIYCWYLPLSKSCRFYVEQFDGELFRKIRKNGFWEHENRLYVPNGKGGWNERIPDGDGWKEVPEE